MDMIVIFGIKLFGNDLECQGFETGLAIWFEIIG